MIITSPAHIFRELLLRRSPHLTRRVLGVLIVLAVLPVKSTPGQTTCTIPSFKTAHSFSAGINPYALVTGDFTGDGELDLAVANGGSNYVSVFLGSGNGNLAPVSNIPVTARSLAAADFNGDGKLDLADADFSNILILLGDGFGGFGAPLTLKAGINPGVVVAADFNGDGRPDVAALNTNSDDISILLNDGNGGFTKATNYVVRPAPGRLALADFNNDGKQDLVVVTTSANIVNNATLLLGNGTGGFQSPIFFDVGPATNINAGEFNGDGKIDLVVSSFFSVKVLFGNGAGGFGPPVAVQSQVGIVAVGDLNRDGKADLVGVNNTQNIVQVLFGNGAGGFTQSPILYADGQPMSAASGDFNDDGYADIAVANWASNDASLLLGNGKGGFDTPDNYDLKASSVQSGDFNNDGKLDLVASIPDSGDKNKIEVLLGNGDGGFPSVVDFPLSTTVPGALWVSDFDGDGKLDLAFSNVSKKGVSILFGKGNGDFSLGKDTQLSEAPSFIVAGDFNNDGKADLAVLTHSPFLVSVLLGDGAGNFAGAWSFNFNGNPSWVTTGDLNGDGKLDLVVTTNSTDAVRILLGQGNGTFVLIGNLQVGSGPTGVTLSDFNGDGKLDIAVTPQDSSAVAVLLGNGAGDFAPPQKFATGISPASVATGDLNGDGKLDLVVCNSVPNDLSVLLGDGGGKFKSAMSMGAGPGLRPIVIADLNGDAKPDIAVLNQGSGAVTVFLSKSCDSTFGSNQIDITKIFVRQHYLDFLNREPDPNGLAFWIGNITSCGSDQQCIDVKRINVSAAYFLSIEFQGTGYLVERIYKSAYGDGTGTSTFGGSHQLPVPVIRLNEFLPDTQEIGNGVIVGQTGWEQVLENNKQAFTTEFVQRSRFTTAFPALMTSAQFVDALNTNAGGPLSQSERNQVVGDLSTGVKTRAQVLRAIAEHQNLVNSEFNRAFVLMQFFGYLRRNPNDPQDTDYTGYDFWLTKLNQFNGNFQNAEMVKAFITSIEYRQRFGP